MPAPKGNKNAVGNNGGRLRKWDREEVRLMLIDWAKKEDSMNLNGFCAQMPDVFDPDNLMQWGKSDVEFAGTYNYVKTLIAARREQMLNKGKLHVKAYDLNSTVYDRFARAEKFALLELEQKIKAEAEAAKQVAPHDELLTSLISAIKGEEKAEDAKS